MLLLKLFKVIFPLLIIVLIAILPSMTEKKSKIVSMFFCYPGVLLLLICYIDNVKRWWKDE